MYVIMYVCLVEIVGVFKFFFSFFANENSGKFSNEPETKHFFPTGSVPQFYGVPT